MIRSAAVLATGSTVTTTSVEDGAQQLFAFPVTGGGCGEDRPHVGAGARQPGQFVVGEPDGAAGLGGQQVTFGLPLRGQLGLQRPFQGAGDQPVLRLDRVVLAAGPVGFVAGPFHGQLEGAQRRGVGLFGVGERVRGRGQGRRFQHGEHLLQDSGLEPPSAEALAALSRRHTAVSRGRTDSEGSCPGCRSSRSASSGRTCRTAAGPAAAPILPAGRRHRTRAAPASWPAAERCWLRRWPSR